LTNQKEGHGEGIWKKVRVEGGIKASLVAGGIQLLFSYFEEVYQRLPRFAQSSLFMEKEQIQRSETSVFNNNKTPGEYPKELLSSLQHGESLKYLEE
jgi:hypothetical protein